MAAVLAVVKRRELDGAYNGWLIIAARATGFGHVIMDFAVHSVDLASHSSLAVPL